MIPTAMIHTIPTRRDRRRRRRRRVLRIGARIVTAGAIAFILWRFAWPGA